MKNFLRTRSVLRVLLPDIIFIKTKLNFRQMTRLKQKLEVLRKSLILEGKNIQRLTLELTNAVFSSLKK